MPVNCFEQTEFAAEPHPGPVKPESPPTQPEGSPVQYGVCVCVIGVERIFDMLVWNFKQQKNALL